MSVRVDIVNKAGQLKKKKKGHRIYHVPRMRNKLVRGTPAPLRNSALALLCRLGLTVGRAISGLGS